MQFDLFDSKTNEILDAKNYAEFKKLLAESNCTKCSLSENRKHIVVDRGNPEAKVLMVGEAPGENEDIQAKAFVGRAGQLLDQMMQEAGMDSNRDALIANVVKCRPPENRAPKQEEVDQCFPFLKKQISLIAPEVIVLLGGTALKHLVHNKGEFSMEKEAGKAFTHPDYPGTQFFVLYHPAFILRDPRKKPVMATHLQILKELISRVKS
ncbi:MAG: uracil-DNA glycosylase [Candidatus Omnitrophica bacterium]|nr:uracil-DNA glycosylase [Candidatus Omnitrophota bacterium]